MPDVSTHLEPSDLISRCRLLPLPTVHDPRGDLTFVEAGRHVPFAIERVFYVTAVPEGQVRAGHANRVLQQVLVAVAGSMEVVLHDGVGEQSFLLDDPREGLYVPGMVWRELRGFAEGTVCLVLCDAPYDEQDYVRDWGEYVRVRCGA